MSNVPEHGLRVSEAGMPTPAEVRQLVRRGRSVVFPLDGATDMRTVFRIARTLQKALPADLLVLGSPNSPPSLRVLQLVGKEEANRAQAALQRLVGDFRQLSQRLVQRLHSEVLPEYERGEPYPEQLRLDDAMWHVDIHGEHCRFEKSAGGEVVEANIDEPDVIDTYFLLLFAQTAGRYPEVQSVCLEGFHDMCRLLDLAGFTDSRPDE